MPNSEKDPLRPMYPWYRHPDDIEVGAGVIVGAGALVADVSLLVTLDDHKQQVIDAAHAEAATANAKIDYLNEVHDALNNKHSAHRLSALIAPAPSQTLAQDSLTPNASPSYNNDGVIYQHDPDVEGIVVSIRGRQALVKTNGLIHDATYHAQAQILHASVEAKSEANRFPSPQDRPQVFGSLGVALALGVGAFFASRKVRIEHHVKKQGKIVAKEAQAYSNLYAHEDS